MVVKVFCIGASWSFGANAVSCSQWRGADRNRPEDDDVDGEFYDGLAFPVYHDAYQDGQVVPRNREQQYRRRPPRQQQQQVQIPPQPRHQVRDAYRRHEQIQRRGPARWDQLPNGQLLARVEVELPARPQEQGFQPQQQIQPAIPVQDPALDVSSAHSTDSSDSADTEYEGDLVTSDDEIWADNDGALNGDWMVNGMVNDFEGGQRPVAAAVPVNEDGYLPQGWRRPHREGQPPPQDGQVQVHWPFADQRLPPALHIATYFPDALHDTLHSMDDCTNFNFLFFT